MDWDSLSAPFESKPMVRRLSSIDTAKGEIRTYSAQDGKAPKLQQVTDLPMDQKPNA